MSALVKWGEKYPPVLSMMAHSVALAAESVYSARLLSREYAPSWSSIEYSDDWLDCYRDEKRVWQIAFEGLNYESPPGEDDESDERWLELEREGDASQDHFERWRESNTGKLKGARLQQALDELNVWSEANQTWGKKFYAYYGACLVDELGRENEAVPDSPPPVEVYFLTHVLIPCWFEYRIKPAALFKSAESGHWKSIEKLLRLDKTMLEHPPIMRLYTRARREKYRGKFDALQRAYEGAPPGPCTISQVKHILGAYILRHFREFDNSLETAEQRCPFLRFKRARLKIPDIQRLFDAVAKDVHGQLRDLDLSESEHTFDITLRRALKVLPEVPIVSQNVFRECESIF